MTMIALNKHVQSRCPDSSTLDYVPRGTRFDQPDFLTNTDYCGVHLPLLF